MTKNIIYGEKIDINMNSSGIQFYEILGEGGQEVLLIDGFTGKTVNKETIFFNSCRLADSLRNYGLCQNDVIGIFSENCLEYCEPILAALYLGITVTTFNSSYVADELIYTVNLSQPKILFCSLNCVSTALAAINRFTVNPKLIIINSDEDFKGCQSLNGFVYSYITPNFNILTFQPVQVNPKEDVAFILYSSGTTGLPKGVMITHLNLNALLTNVRDAFNPVTKIPSIGLMPFYHSYGCFLLCIKIFFCSKLIVLKKFDPNVYLKTIQDYKITVLHIVPPLAYFLAKNQLVSKYDLSSLEGMHCGGAPLSNEIEEALLKRFNLSTIKQSYGMTETTLGVLSPNVNLYCPGSSGTVQPNTQIKIIDIDTGESLGPMKSGEMCCRGALVMKGYVNDPESTKKVIDSEGWLHTGDVAYYDENKLFYIVDRLKELIKYKGFQVAPAELEGVLLTHPEILDAGVVGIPNEESGELPFAFIVKNSKSTLSEDSVKNFIKEKLSSSKHLRGGVKFVNEIPRNPSGKIIRRLLRQQAAALKSKL